MSENEDDVWENAVRDVLPLKPKKIALSTLKRRVNAVQKTQTVMLKPIKHELKINGSHDIDKRTMQRFKRGEMPVEGVLDLHHQTEDKAYDLVRRFVTESYLQGKRCVMIITGKGLHRQDEFSPYDCLKTRVPQWLAQDELCGLILTYIHPQERLGGSGALMLLLRRQRV